MQIRRKVALSVVTGILVASATVVGTPAMATSNGDIDRAFTDYINKSNGLTNGRMEDRGINRRWTFTYVEGGGSWVETYDVNRYDNRVVYYNSVWFGDTQRNSRPSTSDK